MISRRRVLAGALGGLAALAGCQSDGDATDGATTPRGTTPSTADSSSGVSVDGAVTKKAVTYESRMGSGGVFATDDRQYVVGTVSHQGDVDGSGFALVADGRSFDPGLSGPHGAADWTVAGRGTGSVRSPVAHEDRSFVAFDVPSPLSAPDARITYAPTGEAWPLSAEARETLGEPAAAFALESLTVPDSVTVGDSLSVSLSVRNTSDVDGRFLAAVYWPTTVQDDDESTVVDRRVTAGESVGLTVDVDTAYAETDDGATTLTVDGHVGAEREVEVRSADES